MQETNFLRNMEEEYGIFLVGPAGSGKSTVARHLIEQGYTPLYGGDLLREEIKKGTPDGLQIKHCAENGYIISDDIILRVLGPHAQETIKSRFVFDSFPVTIKQFDFLYALLEEADLLTALKIIYLEVDPDVALFRLSGRLTCSECAHVYNLHTKPPQQEGVCDECGGTLFFRQQDQGRIAKERMTVFAEKTLLVLERARDLNIPVVTLKQSSL